MDLVIHSAKKHCIMSCDQLIKLAEDKNHVNPFIFLCASAYIDYLAKLVAGKDEKATGYKNFIEKYLSQVNTLYQDFKYEKKKDLPTQMYHVLRCGIVHSFSLIPDEIAKNKGGRDRSIILCHQTEADANNWHHIMTYQTDKILDGCLFIAEKFVKDIKSVTNQIFDKAKEDAALGENITGWYSKHPPIQGGF